MSQDRLNHLRELVAQDPGREEFVELAKSLSENPENRTEAREICFRGLSSNPSNVLGRLLLARLYYLDSMGEFCVRELLELKKYTAAPSVDKLIDSFGDFAKPFLSASFQRSEARLTSSDEQIVAVEGDQDQSFGQSGESVVAELDLDLDFDEVLDEIDR